MNEKTDKKTCKHWWVEKRISNSLNLCVRLIWVCKHCGVGKDECDMNKRQDGN